jgi:hypothetical protein
VPARSFVTNPLSWLLVALLSVAGCSCDTKHPGGSAAADGGGAGSGVIPFDCAQDDFLCDGAIARVCDGKGGYKSSVDCSKSDQTCLSSRLSAAGVPLKLGCIACTPGTASCADGKASLCREDGSGFDLFDCDPMQGMTCEATGCKGVCAPPEVTTSYIGCDYYPTVTLNPVWSGFDFAVAVSNASNAPAHVIVTRGDAMLRDVTVGVDQLEIIKLDWVAALKGGDQDACQIPPEPGDSRVVRGGAYRLRSDHPVTVYQLSPLQYELGKGGNAPAMCPTGTKCPGGVVAECLSYSNDASLLLPATTLTGDYTVMSWPSRGNTTSFFAVTATADSTLVSLKGRGNFRPGGGVDRSGQGEIMLNRGDVLEVLASHGMDTDDASGSLVRANKPVQVIGGHSCANVPDADTAACDHLEDALFPTQILGKEYVVSYPSAVASQSPYLVRIAAIAANTKIQFEPALVAPITLGPDSAPFELRVGSFVKGAPGERGTEKPPVDVRITSDKPILVVQYMQGQASVPSNAGDPSMSLAVPVAQYRSDYTFTASPTYDSNFIDVIAPIGTTIMLDGLPLDGTSSDVGKSNFEVTRARLPVGGSGVYRIRGDAAFGLVVYGYGRYTSYMYPGGLDLKRITVLQPD